MTPERKVTAGALAGALTVLLAWIAGLCGLDVPAEVAAATTTLLSFAASWYIKAPKEAG